MTGGRDRKRRASWRGDRRLRVALELDDDGARVVSTWVVEGPAVQRAALAGSHAVRVEVDGEVTLVEAFDDPRVARGTPSGKEGGHSFRREPVGRIDVDVPLSAGASVGEVTIDVREIAELDAAPTEPAELARLFDEPPAGMRRHAVIGLADLRRSPGFAAVAPRLGLREAGD